MYIESTFLFIYCYGVITNFYYQQNAMPIEEKQKRIDSYVIRWWSHRGDAKHINIHMCVYIYVYRSCRIISWERERDELVYEDYSLYSEHVHSRWIMTMMSRIIIRFIYLLVSKHKILFLYFQCIHYFLLSSSSSFIFSDPCLNDGVQSSPHLSLTSWS